MEHKKCGRKKGYKNGTEDIDRFLAMTEYDENGCLLWTGLLWDKGYGAFWLREPLKKVKAHRWILQYTLGEDFDESLRSLHTCDVRRCVNPEHLYQGTDAQNVKDMDARGRRKSARGEECGSAKLTENQVREIRREYAAGKISQYTGGRVDIPIRELAVKYGLSSATIYALLRGKNWKHVKDDKTNNTYGQAEF